jgi:hypothetical protein
LWFDFDLIAYGPNVEFKVEWISFRNYDLDRFNFGFFETSRRYAYTIPPRWKKWHCVTAAIVGFKFSLFCGCKAYDRYFSSDDDGAVLVFDRSCNAARSTLRKSRDRQEKKPATDAEPRHRLSLIDLMSVVGHVKTV